MPASAVPPSVVNAYFGTVPPAPVYAIPSSGSPGGITVREQAFTTPQSAWIINHNLGYYPRVQPTNLARQLVNAEVRHVSVNQFQVSFNDPFTGYVIYG